MTDNAYKKCPFCKESIRAEAIKCRFCGEFLEQPPEVQPAAVAPRGSTPSPELTEQDKVAEKKLLFEGALSPVALAGPILRFVIWLIVAGGIAWAGWRYIPADAVIPMLNWPAKRAGWVVSGLVVLYASMTFLIRWIVFRSRRFLVTGDRIECRRGLLSRHVDNLDMWRIRDIHLDQNLVERMMGVGTVIVESNDDSDPHLRLGPIPGARKLFEALREAALAADRRRGVLHIEP